MTKLAVLGACLISFAVLAKDPGAKLWRESKWVLVDSKGSTLGVHLTVTKDGIPSFSTGKKNYTFTEMPDFKRKRYEDPDFDGEKWTGSATSKEQYGTSFPVEVLATHEKGNIRCYRGYSVTFVIDHVADEPEKSSVEVVINSHDSVYLNLTTGGCSYYEPRSETHRFVRVVK